jgi:uncharacterized protein YcnI
MIRTRRSLLAVAMALVALLTTASPAAAHVLIDQTTPRGDGSVEVSLTFDHSCDASPTTELVVEVPEGAELLSGSGPEGWSATVDGSRVVFTGPGIESGQAPRFTLITRLTGSVGEPLLFPTRQTCADGDGYDWDDATESEERPAPRVIATSAVLAEVEGATTAATPVSRPDEGASTTQVVAALAVLGLASLVTARVMLRRAG